MLQSYAAKYIEMINTSNLMLSRKKQAKNES